MCVCVYIYYNVTAGLVDTVRGVTYMYTVYIYVCECVCVHVYIYVCVYIYNMYIHTYV